MVELDTSPRKKIRADDKRDFHSAPRLFFTPPAPLIEYSVDEMSISSEFGEQLRPKRKREEFEAAALTPDPVPKAKPAPEGDIPSPRPKRLRHDSSHSSALTTKLEPTSLPFESPNAHTKDSVIFNELEERFFVNKYYAEINNRLNRLHFENLKGRRMKELRKMVVDEPADRG